MNGTRHQPEISVIIVNWNGMTVLDECLRSLAGQTFQQFETILVDNGSSDGSAAWVAAHYPDVRLLQLAANVGFSAGNNAGLGLARGRYIALLNNDTRVESGWLEALYHCINSDDRIAACDSKVLYNDRPDVVWSAGADYTIAGSVAARGHRQAYPGAASGPQDVFIAVACAAIYRRAVIDDIGFFDERYVNGYEDVDWSFRAHLFGYRIVNVPAARVYHKVSWSQVHNSPEFVYNGQRNVSTTFLKNMPSPLLLKYLPLHAAYALGSFAYFIRLGRAGSFLRAKRDVVLQLPAIWRQRRVLQARRTAPAAAIDALLTRQWLGVKLAKYRKDDHAAG